MRKLAIFVEGQTEQLFCDRLLRAVAVGRELGVELRKAWGGRNFRRALALSARAPGRPAEHFVMIVDCGSDNRVKSDILELYDNLVATGYERIIGLRDVFPDASREQVPRLRRWLDYEVPRRPIDVHFILAIMEIEAWFLMEATHFHRLHKALTPQRVRKRVHFDPVNDNMELRHHPAEDLNRIYQIFGGSYNKRRANTERTLDALDFGRFTTDLREKSEDLNRLVEMLENFLEPRAGEAETRSRGEAATHRGTSAKDRAETPSERRAAPATTAPATAAVSAITPIAAPKPVWWPPSERRSAAREI